MVPEVQSGMLAPPFMDHRMTSELDVIGQTNCRTHEFSHRTPRTLDTLWGETQVPGAPKRTSGVKHCSSGNGLRQMIQD